MENPLAALSDELAGVVEQSGRFVVSVLARPRLSSSGVHWRPGVIVTAHHTIKREEDIRVSLPDGSRATASLIGRDAGTDLAALRIETPGLPSPRLAAAPPRAGSLSLVVGRGAETGVHASLGVISAVAPHWRTWQGGLLDHHIRLDASFYPGASGGAVVNASGEVLGIASSGLTRLAGVAIPASTVERVLEQLLKQGRVARGFLGLGLQAVRLPSRLGQETGLLVVSVEPDGPAEKAGVLLGDVLLSLGGQAVADTDEVQSALETHPIGTPLEARLLRGGEPKEQSIVVGERLGRS